MTDTRTIKPIGPNVLVERDEPARMVGSIALPDSSFEQKREATVIATGPGYPLDDGGFAPLFVQPGDRVILGYVVQENDDRRVLCHEGDILAVVL